MAKNNWYAYKMATIGLIITARTEMHNKYTVYQKKLCIFVSVITSSNFHEV